MIGDWSAGYLRTAGLCHRCLRLLQCLHLLWWLQQCRIRQVVSILKQTGHAIKVEWKMTEMDCDKLECQSWNVTHWLWQWWLFIHSHSPTIPLTARMFSDSSVSKPTCWTVQWSLKNSISIHESYPAIYDRVIDTYMIWKQKTPSGEFYLDLFTSGGPSRWNFISWKQNLGGLYLDLFTSDSIIPLTRIWDWGRCLETA